jgi:hypothetical protein
MDERRPESNGTQKDIFLPRHTISGVVSTHWWPNWEIGYFDVGNRLTTVTLGGVIEIIAMSLVPPFLSTLSSQTDKGSS